MAKKREELTVIVTYEPSRLSSTHLLDAYESIAPSSPIIFENQHPSVDSQAVTENNYDNNK